MSEEGIDYGYCVTCPKCGKIQQRGYESDSVIKCRDCHHEFYVFMEGGFQFSAITHDLTENFYFVFYSERLEMMWILSSEEFLKECVTNKTGKNTGKRSIWFNGNRRDKNTGIKKEYCKKQFEKYIATDFSRFH